MGFHEAANHWLIYTMVIFGILFVAGFAVVSMRKSWRRATELGYTRVQLMNVVKSSLALTVVPAISIVIGVLTLASLLGVPWPWWRLSVVGALAYELMAADMALSAANVELATATANEFVLVMWVMTIGIVGGLFSSLFIAKRVQKGTLKSSSKDPRWGALSSSTFMMTLLVVFIVPMIITGGVTLLTLLSSVVITLILMSIVKKTGAGWLNNFVLALSIIGAMAMSVFWTNLLG